MAVLNRFYIFRIDRARWGERRDILTELASVGVDVDEEFGEVPLDEAGRFEVVRGTATDETVRTLKEEFDVDAFVDMNVGTAAKTDKR